MDKIVLAPEFRLARNASKFSDCHHKMGAVIVDKRPISVGYNRKRTHPIFSDGEKWFTCHAEMSAVLKSDGHLTGCSVYVYRESAKGLPALARPCNKCLEILIEAGIKRVIFTTNEHPYFDEIRL